MNSPLSYPVSAASLLRIFWQYRFLILQMSSREISGRYKGSLAGVGWSFINPVLMLAVYTFVFSVVFSARWGVENEGKADFAIILFVGLIVHSLFSEVVNRAPGLILMNTNYVKKVVFPLEILPVTSLLSAIFHALVSIGVLIIAILSVNGFLYWTAVFLPVTFLPIVPLTLGVAWIISALGVYLRDIGQLTGIVTTVLLFLAPVFYPVKLIPEIYQPFFIY